VFTLETLNRRPVTAGVILAIHDLYHASFREHFHGVHFHDMNYAASASDTRLPSSAANVLSCSAYKIARLSLRHPCMSHIALPCHHHEHRQK
jgi:hypothetical protein